VRSSTSSLLQRMMKKKGSKSHPSRMKSKRDYFPEKRTTIICSQEWKINPRMKWFSSQRRTTIDLNITCENK
jgi:hypothetical protein